MSSLSRTKFVVKGCVSDPMYHRCSKMATILADTGISEIAHCEAMVEIEYQEYLENMKTQIGGGTFEVKTTINFRCSIVRSLIALI